MNINSIIITDSTLVIILFRRLLETALRKKGVCPDEKIAPAKTVNGRFGKSQSYFWPLVSHFDFWVNFSCLTRFIYSAILVPTQFLRKYSAYSASL